jgi:hypothetical protein
MIAEKQNSAGLLHEAIFGLFYTINQKNAGTLLIIVTA